LEREPPRQLRMAWSCNAVSSGSGRNCTWPRANGNRGWSCRAGADLGGGEGRGEDTVAKSGDAVGGRDAEVDGCEPEVGGKEAEVGGREGVGGWRGNAICEREGLAYGSSLRA
jgi:hypothetical protein